MSRQQTVKAIHRTRSHFAPLVKTGGFTIAADVAALEVEVRAYLANPAKDRPVRAAMVRLACGRMDGRAGARISEALEPLLNGTSRKG